VRRLSVLLGAVALAACGGASDGQQAATPADVVKQAAAKMVDARSARFTVVGTMRNKELAGRPLDFGVKGVTQFDGTKEWIWWDMSKIFPAIATSSLPATEREDVRRLLESPRDWLLELRVRGKATWTRLPGATALVGGKPWIRSETGTQSGFVEPGSGQGFSWIDLSALITYLRALGHVEELGREEGLTQYRGRVQLNRLPALAAARERAAVKKRIRQVIRQTGKHALPLEVWIDDGGVARRFRVTDFTPRDPGEKYPTRWRATMDVLEYDVHFDVLRPPARKVMSDKEFQQLAGS
jgi:hypothetical protein